ncbi:MAG: alanine--tRNA ligase [Tenericutes bacterium]|nr:alanine--tRNA ligase [Mycoplasmatota bacterium]
MKDLKRKDMIEMYFDFFKERGHSLIPSASIIPENDATVLFTTAGMHPLVPYLLGQKHPAGNRLVNVQKCLRTSDIESVGDNSHLTFFEMLGNWSLGDYFKKEMINWSYEFLTDEKYLGIPKEKLAFSVFEGNNDAPRDEVSANLWKECGAKESQVFYLSKKHNWWELGSGSGPCGPDSEMFFDTGKEKCSLNCDPSCDCGKYLEIWNDVFMEFEAKNGKYLPLEHKNVDTGMGVERTLVVYNSLTSVYDIEIFVLLRKKLEELTNKKYEENTKAFRVILDHIRTSVFILGDDSSLSPSNVGAGYILRRLIRRMIRFIKNLEVESSILENLALIVIDYYKEDYKELERNKNYIVSSLIEEEIKFNKTLKSGYKTFNKVIKNLEGDTIDGTNAFKLFDTFGFPLEFTIEMANENNLKVDVEGFNKKFKEHQELSRTASSGEFKGGLADTGEGSVKYHTLAHLTLAALQEVYGKEIYQKGCNITSERLRFDFPLDHKMTDEEKLKVESIINKNIDAAIPVIKTEMDLQEAIESGAEGTFSDKYGDRVYVYSIENVSKEICGGPHIENTNQLTHAKIVKEESSSAGVRRIKVIME